MVHMTAKADFIDRLGPTEFPRITAAQPVFRLFHLPAVFDTLAENTVLIADAVAHPGHACCTHRIHKAGRQTSQPAIAQRGVLFRMDHFLRAEAFTF